MQLTAPPPNPRSPESAEPYRSWLRGVGEPRGGGCSVFGRSLLRVRSCARGRGGIPTGGSACGGRRRVRCGRSRCLVCRMAALRIGGSRGIGIGRGRCGGRGRGCGPSRWGGGRRGCCRPMVCVVGCRRRGRLWVRGASAGADDLALLGWAQYMSKEKNKLFEKAWMQIKEMEIKHSLNPSSIRLTISNRF